MYRIKLYLLCVFWLTLLSSCNNVFDIDPPSDSNQGDSFDKLGIGDNFDFSTIRSLEFVVHTHGNTGKPLRGVSLELHKSRPDTTGTLIEKGVSDRDGQKFFEIELPAYLDTLYVVVNYIGLPNLHKLYLGDTPKSSYVIGGSVPDPDVYVTNAISPKPEQVLYTTQRYTGTASPQATFSYIGKYDSQGKPEYLMDEKFEFTADLLEVVNASLPEARPVPNFNPQYISNGTDSELKLKDASEVIVTFLHEGAGYRNAMGYYSYDLNNPPARASAIQKHNIIFPNVSYAGSGGNLNSGVRVNLGRFPANTGIGFFVVPDGWDESSRTVQENRVSDNIKYSNAAFNTFTNAANRSHTVLLNDPNRELLIIGMEDINRPSGDKDFNDAIFVVHTSNYEAVNTQSLATVKSVNGDSDNDGVSDTNDEFPNDPDKAFTSFTPSENAFGSLVFEDLWPLTGDYDMNDLVIKYNYRYILNAASKVTVLEAKFKIEAIGAGYRNGFGIQMNVSPSAIASVKGSKLNGNLISVASNGTENGHDNAVVIVFNNAFDIMRRTTGAFINTEAGAPFVKPIEIPIIIEFTSPINKSELGSTPHNPFIFVNQTRGHEVHLPDFAPTALANSKLFGTGNDDSNPGTGRYYKTSENGIWALHIPEDFKHMKEKESILKGYTRLANWCKSSGNTDKDWYSNTAYRKTTFIY